MTFSKNFKYLDDLIHSGVKEIILGSDIILGEEEKSKYKNGIKLDVDDLIIDGNGHVIDACRRGRIFECTAKNVTLKNIRLKNGYTRDEGGAIVNTDKLTIEDSIFVGNTANNGGAIFNKGDLTIINSLFRKNSAYFGIMDTYLYQCLEILPSGGAIENNRRLTIKQSTFTENTAEDSGGAILNRKGELTIIESIISHNKSIRDGGAIENYGVLIIRRSKLNSNLAFDSGGAIFNLDASLRISDSTIKDNASIWDGAITSYCEKRFSLNRCIIEDNRPNDAY